MIYDVLTAVAYLHTTIPDKAAIGMRAISMIDAARSSNHDDVDIVMAAIETIASDLGNYLCDRLGVDHVMMTFPDSVSDRLIKVMASSNHDQARSIMDDWRRSRTDTAVDIVASMFIIYSCVELQPPSEVM